MHPTTISTSQAGSAAPMARGAYKKVLCPITRKDGKTFWMRVGSAFPNRDGSTNIYLDVLPVNQKLQIRDWDEEDERGRRRDGAGAGAGGGGLGGGGGRDGEGYAPPADFGRGDDLPF